MLPGLQDDPYDPGLVTGQTNISFLLLWDWGGIRAGGNVNSTWSLDVLQVLWYPQKVKPANKSRIKFKD